MNRPSRIAVGLLAGGLALAGGRALAVEPPPLKTIAGAELLALENDPNVTKVDLPGTPGFQSTAMARTPTYGTLPPLSPYSVQKKVGLTAAVYRGSYSEIVPPAYTPTLAPPLPDTADLFQFKDTKDAAQVWATMSDQGRAYLLARAIGKASVRAAVSWTASYTVSTLSDVYVQFVVPAMVVNSTFEADGPALFKARLRVDLLAVGYPAWSSETMLWNEVDFFTELLTGKKKGTEELRRRLVFKNALGIPTNKDAGSNHSSTAKTITVHLGRFTAAKAVDLTFSIQADVENDRLCEEDSDDENFCTVSSIKAEWNEAAKVPRLFVKPVP